MTRILLLDTGPLGLITHPKASQESDRCNKWMRFQLIKGTRVLVPGISDYELRREMLLVGNNRGIIKLDALREAIGFAPITVTVMDQAAKFWAQARKMGKPTSSDPALDGDMILSAHAWVISREGHEVLVATTNVKHLGLFCAASLWTDLE
jgi:predicted nucleic acid-binding protein